MTDPAQPPPFQPPPAGPGLTPPPPGAPAAGAAPQQARTSPDGIAGMAADPSTLAATGLIAAVLFAIGAGLIAVLGDPGINGFRGRLMNLTNTVDAGDVALLGIAVVLLLLTPDPPGGVARPLLLQATALLAAVISFYGVIRALTIVSNTALDWPARIAQFIATVGLSMAAATIAFYAAKESFLKKEGRI